MRTSGLQLTSIDLQLQLLSADRDRAVYCYCSIDRLPVRIQHSGPARVDHSVASFRPGIYTHIRSAGRSEETLNERYQVWVLWLGGWYNWNVPGSDLCDGRVCGRCADDST